MPRLGLSTPVRPTVGPTQPTKRIEVAHAPPPTSGHQVGPPSSSTERLQADFLRMVVGQFASSDFDAEHPVCLWLAQHHGLDEESVRWLCCLYMAFYDEASAWVVFCQSDPFRLPTELDPKLPIGRNRRNLYGGRISWHLEALCAARATAVAWPYHDFTGDPRADWKRLNATLRGVWGNGRFGTYTTAEMLHKVAGAAVEVTGFDNKDSSGPADGVRRLYGCGTTLAELDRYTEVTHQLLLTHGLTPTYTVLDRGVTESVLCNFGGCCRGMFYSGRNLDRQQGRVLAVEALGYTLPVLWEARGAVFCPEYLGEYNTWVGVDKPRLTVYRDTGVMWWPNEYRSNAG